ncbi:MAG TPA: type III-B CRISPR module RAMP protein Cmr4 [Ghiorsea sp.]|nr:type III-B CRISPR module RAMP protein Cmr4 [Ghiorsea sp.]
MKTQLISLFAETFIHPGCGQNEGAIDLPVARERVTQYPFIAGSSMKGAWRDYAEQNLKTPKEIDLESKIQSEKDAESKELLEMELEELQDSDAAKDAINKIFGKQDNAGKLLISDARLLLLPVRSLQHSYCQVTCPALLARLNRELKRSASSINILNIPSIEKNKYLGEDTGNIPLFLEERNFKFKEKIDNQLLEGLQKFIPDDYCKQQLKDNLVIINDNDFKWFAKNALSIQARNVLDDDKQSQNLWYEEALPPDTVMYSLISQRNKQGNELATLQKTYEEIQYLQVGGNETVGQGWFYISTPKPNASEEGQ